MNYRLPVSRMENALKVGGIREIVTKAEALEAQGRKVVHLEIGRPDYDSPACAKAAVERALARGDVHYTNLAGTPELRREIAAFEKRSQGLEVDPDNEVIVTVGAIEALATVLFSMLEPGDEVLVPAPFFPGYSIQIELAEAVLREVPCSFENGFRLQPEALEAAVGPRTRMLLLNSPNNPTGAALSLEDLRRIADFAVRHDLLVVSDECYEKFFYDGEHRSIATLPGMRERTLIISAASKTFSMTGWRVGWLLVPPDVKPYAAKCHQHLTTCAVSFAQAGVAEALRSADGDVQEMIAGYRERRDFLCRRLREIDGFELVEPQGAFYVFPRVEKLTRRLGMNATELAAWLLEHAGVATVPGEAFHAEGDFLRMAYCRPLDELAAAMDGIERALL